MPLAAARHRFENRWYPGRDDQALTFHVARMPYSPHARLPVGPMRRLPDWPTAKLLTRAVLVDQFFDAAGVGDSGHGDFDAALASAADADGADVEDALEKCLVQLHVADVAVPDFGNGLGENPFS